MTLRIDISSLPEPIRRSLLVGEAVEIEGDGRVLGVLRPETLSPGTVAAFVERRRASPPLDADAFESDIQLGLSMLDSQPYARE